MAPIFPIQQKGKIKRRKLQKDITKINLKNTSTAIEKIDIILKNTFCS